MRAPSTIACDAASAAVSCLRKVEGARGIQHDAVLCSHTASNLPAAQTRRAAWHLRVHARQTQLCCALCARRHSRCKPTARNQRLHGLTHRLTHCRSAGRHARRAAAARLQGAVRAAARAEGGGSAPCGDLRGAGHRAAGARPPCRRPRHLPPGLRRQAREQEARFVLELPA